MENGLITTFLSRTKNSRCGHVFVSLHCIHVPIGQAIQTRQTQLSFPGWPVYPSPLEGGTFLSPINPPPSSWSLLASSQKIGSSGALAPSKFASRLLFPSSNGIGMLNLGRSKYLGLRPGPPQSVMGVTPSIPSRPLQMWPKSC